MLVNLDNLTTIKVGQLYAKNQLEGLNDRAILSLRWNAASSGVSAILQVLQMVWLARLLTPADFGWMAMAWVVVRCAAPFFTGGIGQSIIQQKEISREQFSTLFWIQMALGILTFAGVYLSTPLWVAFFQVPEISALLLICGLSFTFAPAGNTFQALFTRQMRFDKLALIQVSGALADLITSVWLAYSGWGALSVCWGFFARQLLTTIASGWLGKNHAPSLTFQIGQVKPMLKFASFETANNLVYALHGMLDKAILSRFLSAHDLGLYFIAWELAMTPLSKINPVFTKVSFPLFAKLQDQPGKLNHYFMEMTRPLLALNLPVLIGISMLAAPLLIAFFGPQWASAGACLSLLGVLGLEKVLANTGAGVFLAKGRADYNLLWNLISTGAIFLSIVFFLNQSPSIESAALAQVLAMGILFSVWLFLLKRVGNIRIPQLLMVLLRRLVLCIPFSLALLLSLYWFTSPLAVLTMGLISALFVYLPTIWLFDRTLITNLFR